MSIIFSSILAILPLYIIGGFGFFYNKYCSLQEKTIQQFNAFVFDVLYPIQFFYSIYTGGLSNQFSIKFLVMIALGSVISFAVSFVCAKKSSKEIGQQGVLHQAFFRGNMLVFGVAIASSIFEPSQQSFYLVAMGPILLIQNIGMMFGIFLFDENEKEFSFWKVFWKSITNAKILAIIVGVIFVKLQVPVPGFVLSSLKDLSGVATPLCLVLIGAGLKLEGLNKESGKLLIKSIIIKLLILPIIAIAIITVMKLEFVEAFVALLMFATPPSLTTYIIALDKNWDTGLASGMLFYTTCLSLLTLTFWIYILQMIV